jgi:hypothetical protein
VQSLAGNSSRGRYSLVDRGRGDSAMSTPVLRSRKIGTAVGIVKDGLTARTAEQKSKK